MHQQSIIYGLVFLGGFFTALGLVWLGAIFIERHERKSLLKELPPLFPGDP